MVKDGRLLFPIGCYELPKDDAELKKMAQSGINLVRCHNKTDLDRASSVGILGWISLPLQSGNSDSLRKRIESLVIVGDATKRWKQVGRNQKPVWMVLQAFSWSELGDYYGHKTVVYPSFAESRFMAYDVIVHGAKGILYWGSHYSKSSEFRQSLYALTSELEALQPFLVTTEHQNARISLIELSRDSSERGVKISIRRVEGEWIIILVNEDNRTYMGVEVTGLGAFKGCDLELLYGQEKMTVQQGELITRIKPLEVKVYSTSRKYETGLRKGRDFKK